MGETSKDGITTDYQSASPLSTVLDTPNSYSATRDGITAWGNSKEEAIANLHKEESKR